MGKAPSSLPHSASQLIEGICPFHVGYLKAAAPFAPSLHPPPFSPPPRPSCLGSRRRSFVSPRWTTSPGGAPPTAPFPAFRWRGPASRERTFARWHTDTHTPITRRYPECNCAGFTFWERLQGSDSSLAVSFTLLHLQRKQKHGLGTCSRVCVCVCALLGCL